MTKGRFDKPLIVDGWAIQRHLVAYIEAELRQYPLRRARLQTIERTESEVIWASPHGEPGMPRAPGVSDPTPGRVAALERMGHGAELAYLRDWLAQVENTFHRLPLDRQQVINRMYFEYGRHTPEAIASELHIHLATLYRHRNRSLLAYAVAMFGAGAVTYVDAKNLRASGPVKGL